jgi:mono/diheme cytochrome c family protein
MEDRMARPGFVVLLAALLASTPAVAQDVALGRTLVSTYCAVCHSIERAGASPHEAAPPFRTLQERYDVDMLSEALVEGLVSGHPDMPEFAFEPYEAASIVAYIKSLTE